MNEETTIKVILGGDTSAYRQLVERYQTGLIIYCENIIKDRDVAEDIAQDAFVKAYYSLGKFDRSRGSFSTWLYRIATNKAKDHLRKNKQKAVAISEDLIVEEHPKLSGAEISEIRNVVANLKPPEYSHVIRAYYWEGKRYEDIAMELNVPKNTVATWISRAKQQLGKELS